MSTPASNDLKSPSETPQRPSFARGRRIAFISGFFPPNAPMGAVRPGKLAQHWRRLGHDVRVIAVDYESRNAPGPPSASNVYYVPFTEPGESLSAIKSALVSLAKRLMPARDTLHSAASVEHGPQRIAEIYNAARFDLAEFYRQAILRPDRYRSWAAPAAELALAWSPAWRPELIYSSGPPHSSHIAAAILAKRLAVPWIAELRDLWANNPYAEIYPLLRPFHDRLARKTLAEADALVVVTRGALEEMTALTAAPVVLSYNGYDPDDFAGLDDVPPLDPERLTILHAGVIYIGRRDPTPLFQAIASLGNDAKLIRCLFYHDEHNSVAALARSCGIADCVEVRDRVARAEILRIERQVDVLLECRWQNPSGDGVIPGKLFEYIGAKRPILSLGSVSGEGAAIVRESGLGLASNDAGEIRDWLQKMLETKLRLGRLPDISGGADLRFRRETQFQKIDELIRDLLSRNSHRPNDMPG